jgi:hypothetical protein
MFKTGLKGRFLYFMANLSCFVSSGGHGQLKSSAYFVGLIHSLAKDQYDNDFQNYLASLTNEKCGAQKR